MFLNYIQHELVPSLHAEDLVIMDHLRCHKVKGIKEAIQRTGAQLLYLPPYSPDFNPIEMMWSKLKAILRKVKARIADSLPATLPKAFRAASVRKYYGLVSLIRLFAFLSGIAVVRQEQILLKL